MTKTLAALALLAVGLTSSAQAAIRICPHTGKPFDDVRNVYVDGSSVIHRPRRHQTDVIRADQIQWTYQGYNDYLGY